MRSPTAVSPILQQLAQQASDDPERIFLTLAHHIDVDFLREAYHRTSKKSTPGVDGVTASAYAENLEANLSRLHETLRTGRYKALPVKRTWLDKEDGSRRPIGVPVLEDKIVQRAVLTLLEAIYEQDFHAFSYGFRPGRSPHDALRGCTPLRQRFLGRSRSCFPPSVRNFLHTISPPWGIRAGSIRCRFHPMAPPSLPCLVERSYCGKRPKGSVLPGWSKSPGMSSGHRQRRNWNIRWSLKYWIRTARFFPGRSSPLRSPLGRGRSRQAPTQPMPMAGSPAR